MRIVAGTARAGPPFTVDAVVMEQDSALVLDSEPILTDPGAPMPALLEALAESKPQPPGSVVVRGQAKPYCFLAIVHDFASDPSWTEAWVSAAFDAVFSAAASRGLQAIGLPLLGTVYGRLERWRSVELLERSLTRRGPDALKRIWLLVPSRSDSTLLRPLRRAGYRVSFIGSRRNARL